MFPISYGMNKSKKKVLIFAVAYHPFVGGAEIAVQEITKRLYSAFDFHLITLRIDKRLPKEEKIGDISVYRIGWGRGEAKFKAATSLALTCSKYLFPFWASLKASRLHKKENFSFTWSIMASYSGFAALFFKLMHPKVPFVLTLQEGDPIDHIKERVGIFMPLYKKIFSKADIVQTISNFLAGFAKKMGYGRKLVVIPNGVSLEHFSKSFSIEELDPIKKELGKQEGDVFLITVSRLVKKNAIGQIIKALTYLPENFKLFIAGEGKEEEELKKLVQKLNLEKRVVFGGTVDHQRLPLYLQACDVFVRPSRSEGLGSSFIEAMAAGIPVVATAVGGIPDFLEDGKTGLFCKMDNPEDVAKQIKRLIDDKKLRETIIENAKEKALRDYDWNFISNRMNSEVFDIV
jgi:glycosyltransferase involved in cell wall biosynthesis